MARMVRSACGPARSTDAERQAAEELGVEVGVRAGDEGVGMSGNRRQWTALDKMRVSLTKRLPMLRRP